MGWTVDCMIELFKKLQLTPCMMLLNASSIFAHYWYRTGYRAVTPGWGGGDPEHIQPPAGVGGQASSDILLRGCALGQSDCQVRHSEEEMHMWLFQFCRVKIFPLWKCTPHRGKINKDFQVAKAWGCWAVSKIQTRVYGVTDIWSCWHREAWHLIGDYEEKWHHVDI